MITECGVMFLLIYAAGAIGIVGNRLLLWSSWPLCLAGGFTGAILISLGTTLSADQKGFAVGFLTAALAILFRWLSHESTAPAPAKRAVYADEHERVEDIFDFEEVAP